MHHRVLIRAFALCSTIVAASGCATSALLEQELTKTNTQTVLAFEETVYNKHEVQQAFEHYIAPGFVEHDARLVAHPGSADGAAAERGYRALIAHEAPDAHRVFTRTIAQGQLVATQSLWDRDSRTGHAAVVDIYRLREGRIVEHWDVIEAAAERGGAVRGSGENAIPGASLPP
ncbi:MAG TPA: nuclear transport factor 2 family protein [Steroidobacteraceae bacterium]|jgi:predicted SnoaL-like aldol condensation-catalyzing enzyme